MQDKTVEEAKANVKKDDRIKTTDVTNTKGMTFEDFKLS